MTKLKTIVGSAIIIFGVVFAGLNVYALYAFNQPDIFRATTQVYISSATFSGGDVADKDQEHAIKTLFEETIFSRPYLQKIARMSDLDLRAETDSELEGLVDEMQLNIGVSVKKSLRESGSLVHISYNDFDPEQAKSVLHSTLRLLAESTADSSNFDSLPIEEKLRLANEHKIEYKVITPPRVPLSPEWNRHQWIKNFVNGVLR